MKIIKFLLQLLVKLFFAVYFELFGKPKLTSSMRKTLNLYKSGDFSEIFQMIRLWDAPYEEIDKMIPKSGVIVDLGSGDGLLANYIAISRPKTRVYGVEINKERAEESMKGVKNATFVYGDILKKDVPKADTILIIHVLHHLLSRKDQEKILKECVSKLKKGGKLIVAEVSREPFAKYIFSWITDHFIVPILFEGRLYNPDVFFRTNEEWGELFNKLGLKYKIIKAHSGKPFSHVVFECNKGLQK